MLIPQGDLQRSNMMTVSLTTKTKKSYFVKYFYSLRFASLPFCELEMSECSMLRSNIQHTEIKDKLLKAGFSVHSVDRS